MAKTTPIDVDTWNFVNFSLIKWVKIGVRGNKNEVQLGFLASAKSLKYLPKFFAMIWGTNKALFVANIAARLLQATIPVFVLWVGKLLIDEIILQIGTEEKSFQFIWIYLAIEFGLALLSDLLSRIINLVDALLGDL
ncbi:MAG: hypothetical protein OEM26_20695, partial [Saprospiraceae bacterium]|nr:hypothetical protein [Saprospiraceae bacterium]